jgi:Raf kinase inhibitor-like YbhB/YbcL family protein
MRITSTAFPDGSSVPSRFTCDGNNISPALAWTDVPEGTRSLVLLCDDPDAPGGTWHHWAVYDIPPDQQGLPEHVSPQSGGKYRQAINDFDQPGYGGPCPPRGHGPHHYHFRLLALSIEQLPVGQRASCAEVEGAARQHLVAEATLVGVYTRRR